MANYRDFHRRSLAERDAFWAEEARLVHWQRPFEKVLDYSRPPFARWFVGGETNLCYNAVDRHLAARGAQSALVWISTEVDETRRFTFRQLFEEVNRVAAMMRSLGVKRGDRVIIYMPMIPEACFAILACARLGAIHSVVFGGFAAASLAARIDDARPALMITADGGSRMGKSVLYKSLVDESHRAQHEWARTKVAERQAVCTRVVEAFASRREQIAADLTRQMGKPLVQARREVDGMMDRARTMIGLAPAALADEALPPKAGFARFIRHEPLGVVLDIAAWNYPLLIAVNVVVPAVLAGDSVILKHSARTPLCGEHFERAFRDAGAPANLVRAVHASHGVTERIIGDARVGFVSFTGSVAGGRAVHHAASSRFIDCGLELGGKDPAYVCADADFAFVYDLLVGPLFMRAVIWGQPLAPDAAERTADVVLAAFGTASRDS